MRGSLKLFDTVFTAVEVQPAADATKRKGRSAELHSRRNECLIDRFYYYGKFTDKRYTRILEELSNEFFISMVTIPEVMEDNFEQLARLKQQEPNRAYFLKKWPHLVWPVKE